ncbi:MAG TPA: hypothetical protein DCY31_07230 [Ruminococcaceae bacterium]|nr:hypothetical protein [Oscillospiraceae bacterium]
MEIKKHIHKKDIIFFVGLFILAVFSFWRAHYGAEAYDEPFYLTIPYRMVKGDVLFLHEWHGSQLSAFILYPFVKVYLLIFKSTEGIILFFRYLYIIINAIASIAVYSRLRQFGISGSVAVLFYYIFAHHNVLTLGYNSMGYMFILLSSTFIATNFNKNKAVYFVSGIFFAGAVLCQPVLAFFFLVAFVVICIIAVSKKTDNLLKKYGVFTVGCAVPAVPIVIYFLKEIGISNIMISIKMITADPEHSQSLASSLYRTYTSYFLGSFVYTSISFVILFSLSLVLIKLKKRNLFPVIISFISITYFVFKVASYLSFSTIDFVYFPIALSGIIAAVGVKDKKTRKYFIVSLIFSVVHFCSFISSNEYRYVMTPALMPTYVASIIACWKLIEENHSEVKKWMKVMYKVGMAISLSAVIILTGYYRYEGIFSYSGQRTIKEMTILIDAGCYSNIWTSKDFDINEYKADYDQCQFTKDDKVLILSARTWLTLENQGVTAQYSAWLSGIGESTIERLNEYYKLNPERKPDYVYICKDEAKENNYDIIKWAEKNNRKVKESALSYVIYL